MHLVSLFSSRPNHNFSTIELILQRRWLRWNNIKMLFPVIIILYYLWTSEAISSWYTVCLLIIGIKLYLWMNLRKIIQSEDAIVITGCDTGLGFSLACHCFIDLKMQVIAAVHNTNSKGSKKLSEIGIKVYPLEITEKENIQSFVRFLKNYLEENNYVLRSIVNNAGSMVFGEFEWQTEDQIDQQVAVNLLGTMKFTKECLPLVRKNSSRLIVVTSHCSCEPLPGVATYCATKAGLSAWATALRTEQKKYGVEVVNFIPGSFIDKSNLLSQQMTKFNKMESEMTEEAKKFYSDYFNRYSNYFSPLSRDVGPQRIENPQLYEIFDDALLDSYPQATYKCEPWRYAIYHCLFKITPMPIRDWLVDKFMQVPAWKEKY